MDSEVRYIIDRLITKSNIIVGFIVIQSITLSYKLSSQAFIDKLIASVFMPYFIFISHLLILVGALAGILILGRKQHNIMPLAIKVSLHPLYDSYIKCALMLLFGPIPLILIAIII